MIRLRNARPIAHESEPLRPDVLLCHAEERHDALAAEQGRDVADAYLASVREAATRMTND